MEQRMQVGEINQHILYVYVTLRCYLWKHVFEADALSGLKEVRYHLSHILSWTINPG